MDRFTGRGIMGYLKTKPPKRPKYVKWSLYKSPAGPIPSRLAGSSLRPQVVEFLGAKLAAVTSRERQLCLSAASTVSRSRKIAQFSGRAVNRAQSHTVQECMANPETSLPKVMLY